MLKLKRPVNGKLVHVVLAYKLGMSARGSKVFFEVFSSYKAARTWCDTIEAEGFHTQIQKKVVVS
jgi:hypothetical protein